MDSQTTFKVEQKKYFQSVKYRAADDPVVRAYAEPKLEFIRRHVAIDRSTEILDVGCGNGIFTVPFAKLSDRVVGIDMTEELLRENPHRDVHVGDATALAFADRSFDVAFEANILHHVDEPQRAIREMVRVSRKYIVLLEPNRYNPLMAVFGLLVRAERGVLKSSLGILKSMVQDAGARVTATLVTGMITQNATPAFLLPVLKLFDRPIWWGEYVVIVAEKPNATA